MRLKFGLEDLIGHFKETTISEVYTNFYALIHDVPALESTAFSTAYAVVEELEKICGENLGESLDFRMIDTPQYESIVEKIKEKAGAVAEPYLEENELLGRFRNTFDVVLMYIYSTSPKDIPEGIRKKVHLDDPYTDEWTILYNAGEFKDWLTEHPDKDTFTVDNELRIYLERLYGRIQDLVQFYNQGRAAPIHRNYKSARRGTIKSLNKVFGRKKVRVALQKALGKKG